jgi:hypothetical protein
MIGVVYGDREHRDCHGRPMGLSLASRFAVICDPEFHALYATMVTALSSYEASR